MTILIGGHGSGKCEFAIMWAKRLVVDGHSPVTLADLDTIQPLFRSQEASKALQHEGIKMVISSVPASDMPSIPPQLTSQMGDREKWMVIDVGGDAAGARILCSISNYLHGCDYNLFFILNTRRPYNENPESASRELQRIEAVSGLKITGLISNTHLLDETNHSLIRDGIEITRNLADKLGIDFIGVMIPEELRENFRVPDDLELFPLRRMLNPPWMREY